MSSSRTVALSASIAAIIAIGLIVLIVFVPGVGLAQSKVTNTTSAGTSSQVDQEGTLAVLLTDPPTLPANVTAVYMQYSRVQAHIANAGNQTGWYDLTGSGEINLVSVVNASETIATQNLPQGSFNGLRFNATSIIVTYNDQNYTGLIVKGRNTLYVWIPGGISVRAAETAAAMIDMTPTAIMVGGMTTNPTFVFLPVAAGYVIPTSSIPAQSHTLGARYNLSTTDWWIGIQRSTEFQITGVSLTPNSLTMNITNTGTASVDIRLAAISTQNTLYGGIESMMKTSEIYVVSSDGSLLDLNTTSISAVESQVAASGILLAPGSTMTLHYSGAAIDIGLQAARSSLHMSALGAQNIIPGEGYHVWLQGNGQVVEAGVIAQTAPP